VVFQHPAKALMNHRVSRRHFIATAAMTAGGLALAGCRTARPRRLAANEKLNIAMIGTANRAREDLNGVQQENIIALCDIDDRFLAAAHQRFPAARTYNDFRKMLEQRDIDAVVIGTADHTHALATAAALRLGKHVYCEKPLTHTVYEARTITRLAARNKHLATQMGTQIHATSNYRRVVELVQSGAIGEVAECHVWCEKTLKNSERPIDTPPVPAGLLWDLWLGPAPARPYHPAYLPKTWRHWWDFGEGILGDMACHYVDLPFWALKLEHPLTIEAEGPPIHPETTPEWLIVRHQFPARGKSPPVRLTWYDGGRRPEIFSRNLESWYFGKKPPEEAPRVNWPNGILFVGNKGMLIADYGRHKLLPEAKFEGFQPPAPFIAESIGHHAEWIKACKTGSPTTCHFGYAGPLTEAVLLGNVAYRTGEKLQWDAAGCKVKNSRQAASYLRTEYTRGWTL
jgi:predicted dehydrogenase